MSSKHSLPESMELLLDTMCNTFGGVMFIAISMAMLVFMLHREFSPEKREEMDKKIIESLDRQEQRLNSRHELIKKEIEMLKREIAVKMPEAGNLQESVIAQEQKLRRLEAEISTLEHKINSARRRTEKLKNTNDNTRKALEKAKQHISEKLKILKQRNHHLTNEIYQWRKTLADTPKRHIHFSRNLRTEQQPYTILIKDGFIYRLGTNVRTSSSEVSVRLEGNIVHMTPRHGTPISSLTLEEVNSMFPGFDRRKNFLWVEVSPESLAAFVPLRRMLRKLQFPVYWYTENEFHVILVREATYSAAQ